MWFNVFEILLTITLFLSWKVEYIDEPDTVYDVPINFNTIPTIKSAPPMATIHSIISFFN